MECVEVDAYPTSISTAKVGIEDWKDFCQIVMDDPDAEYEFDEDSDGHHYTAHLPYPELFFKIRDTAVADYDFTEADSPDICRQLFADIKEVVDEWLRWLETKDIECISFFVSE